MDVLVEISARHVHISELHFKRLFGEDRKLDFSAWLSQPGQFVSKNRISIVGSRSIIPNVVILGPHREKTQVEVSVTDAIKLGIKPFVRESGDIALTPGCVLEGPNGKIALDEGVIVAKRHIHMTPADAEKLSLKDHELVKVAINRAPRSLVFSDVVVRVSEKFSTAMHVDTDEANSAGIFDLTYGKILV